MASLSTEQPNTSLRQRMLEDMAIGGLSAHTQRDYIRHVRGFAVFLGRPPDTAAGVVIRRYQLHQREIGAGAATINSTVSTLHFRCCVTLDRHDPTRWLVITRHPRKLPELLGVEEVGRLLEAAPAIKYRAALGMAYGAGLRVAEVAHFKVDDIDINRMMIRVEQGKRVLSDCLGRQSKGAQGPQRHALAAAARAAAAVVMAGCSPVAVTQIPSRLGTSIAPSMKRPRRPGSASGSARTRCATASPRT